MIDISKTYRTRDGREVRIYATDGGGSHPVHGAIKDGERWYQGEWSPDGSWYGCAADDYDLIEVKPRIRREVWLNVYDNDDVISARSSKEAADRAWSVGHRIACVHVVIDCEEGEGL